METEQLEIHCNIGERESYGTIKKKKVDCMVLEEEGGISYFVQLGNGDSIHISYVCDMIDEVCMIIDNVEEFNTFNEVKFTATDYMKNKYYKLEQTGSLSIPEVVENFSKNSL